MPAPRRNPRVRRQAQSGMTKAQSGSLGGQSGGASRARTLTKHQRQEIARKGGRAKAG